MGLSWWFWLCWRNVGYTYHARQAQNRGTTMTDTVRIGLIGDFNPDVKAHSAIPQALMLASRPVGCDVVAEWLPTPSLESETEERLSGFDGLWIVPASPYESMEGAL